MRFSPLLISNLIIQPLRYFFHNYPVNDDLIWDVDPKKTKMDIGAINDYHKLPLQEKPRILVDRGAYTISNTGLSDDLAVGKSVFETKGVENRINMVFIQGTATLLLEARQEGTVELLADAVSHFLIWTKPYICESQGFKKFFIPAQVSSPRPSKEDKEIFQVVVSGPWLMEEQWNVRTDALKLNQFFIDFKPI